MGHIDNPMSRSQSLPGQLATLAQQVQENNRKTPKQAANLSTPGTLTVGGASTLSGPLSAAAATFSGPLSAPAATLTGALSGTTGSFSGVVSAASFTGIQPGDVPALDAGKITTGTLSLPLTTSGAVSAGSGSFSSSLTSLGAYSNNITTTRAAMWISSTGSIGIASSSERFKTGVVKATVDPLAVLAMEVDFYEYRAEIAKRDDPESADYVGPDYRVHTEIGVIAERLHEAGLWPFVIYERDEDGEPLTDDNGDPIPYGVHYELLALAVHIATQYVYSLVLGHESRLQAIEKVLNITPSEVNQ